MGCDLMSLSVKELPLNFNLKPSFKWEYQTLLIDKYFPRCNENTETR